MNCGSMAVQFAEEYILTHRRVSNEESVLSGIKKLMEEANTTIYTKALESQSTLGMGTTFITVVMLKNKMYIGHEAIASIFDKRRRHGKSNYPIIPL